MNKITLTFTPQELDYIANCLADRPWKEANALMVNIQTQVQEQQNASRNPTSPGPQSADAAQGSGS